MIALAIAAAVQLSYGEFMHYLRDKTEGSYRISEEMIPRYQAIGQTGHILCKMSTQAEAAVIELEAVKEEGKMFITDPKFYTSNGPTYVLSEEEKGWVSSEIRAMKLAALEYGTYCSR